MKTSFSMVLYKECKHSFRYEADNKEEAATHSFYLLKDHCKGKPPKSILVSIVGIE